MRTEPKKQTDKTFAEQLFYLRDPKLRADLESFRAQYEVKHGHGDITRRYTSVWPTAQQVWLFNDRPQKWFDGLPEFAKAFIVEVVWQWHERGELDVGFPRNPVESANATPYHEWIQHGPDDRERINPYWVRQVLGGDPIAPDDPARSFGRGLA